MKATSWLGLQRWIIPGVAAKETEKGSKTPLTSFRPTPLHCSENRSPSSSDSAAHTVDLPAKSDAMIQRLPETSVAQIARKRRAFLQDASFQRQWQQPSFGGRESRHENEPLQYGTAFSSSCCFFHIDVEHKTCIHLRGDAEQFLFEGPGHLSAGHYTQHGRPLLSGQSPCGFISA